VHFILNLICFRGPFIELSSGARLVDLPGMNDICEARVQLMNKYLLDCRYIWVLSSIHLDEVGGTSKVDYVVGDGRERRLIVIDIDRCATDAGSQMLINDKFLTKLANNKMWASLSCISTNSLLFQKYFLLCSTRYCNEI
jgi:hypothetical protein